MSKAVVSALASHPRLRSSHRPGRSGSKI